MHKIYAQMIGGTVHAIFSISVGADNYGPGVEMVDVTDFDPCPEPGWLYRPGEDVLFVPPEPTVDPDPPSPLTLEEARVQALARIQEEKSRRLSAGFMVGPVLFDSDMSARVAYVEFSLRLADDPSLSVRWKASAGQWVDMGAALFQQVQSAGEAHVRACFAWQEQKSGEVMAAQTVDDVLAVSLD